MNVEPIQIRPEDPASERWMQYYKEARARRRARGPEESTRERARRLRNRQRAYAGIGFFVVGVLFSICYVVLQLQR